MRVEAMQEVARLMVLLETDRLLALRSVAVALSLASLLDRKETGEVKKLPMTG